MKGSESVGTAEQPLVNSDYSTSVGTGVLPGDFKAAVDQFAPSECFIRRIIESTQEGIWMSDLQGVTRFINPQMARMLRCEQRDAIGRSVFEFVFEEDRAQVRQHFDQFLRAEKGVEIRERLRRKDGSEFWGLVSASVFRTPNNQPVGFLGMFTDITESKRAEDALRQSEERLQLQIKRMPIGHILWSPEFLVLSWNPQAEKIFGFSATEALGKHPFDLIVPANCQPAVREVWSRLLHGDETAHSLNENVTKSGQTIICEWSNTPIRSRDGVVIGVLSMVQDITARCRAEEAARSTVALLEERVQERTAELRQSHEALIENEQKYRRLFETISDAAFIFDAETRRFLDVNRAALVLYGYSRDEFLTKFQPDISAEPADSDVTILLLLAGGCPRIPLRYHRKRDGTVFPVEISASSFVLQGRPVVCGIVRDITLRQQAEAGLRRREQELADFFADAPLGLLWVDVQGRIERVNQAQLNLFGRSGEEVFGKPVAQFFEDRAAVAELQTRIARGETVRNFRTRLRRPGGPLLDAIIDANGLWDNGQLLHARWFVRDITHSLQLEREILAISEREQRRLGQDLHDDLSQQLAGIEFLCQRLALRLRQLPPASEQAAEIARMVQQALARTRDLARGLSPFRLQVEGLADALRDLATRTTKVFGIKCAFQGSIRVPLNDLTLSAHLYRIAQEAISNAVKHGHAHAIRVRLTSVNKGVRLFVTDDGIGLPEVPPSSAGMGLQIMRYRAEVMGGSLVLRGHPQGGTTVLCFVPRTPPIL